MTRLFLLCFPMSMQLERRRTRELEEREREREETWLIGDFLSGWYMVLLIGLLNVVSQ